jgi:hypothetical protein
MKMNAGSRDRSEFTPTDTTRVALKSLAGGLADAAEEKFFEVWEAEINDPDAPRMAGSVIAAAYMKNAARFAVFGARCAGKEPSLKLWLDLARQNYFEAVDAVNRSVDIAAEDGTLIG